jgi:hypothetical protein
MKPAIMIYANKGGRIGTDGQRHAYARYLVEEVGIEDDESDGGDGGETTDIDDPLTAEDLPKIGTTTKDGWVCAELSWELDANLETTAVVTADCVRDPCSLPLEVSIYSSHKQVAAWKQTNAMNEEVPICNSCGDLYNPPLSYDKSVIRLEILRRYRNKDFDESWITDYVDHVNDDDFTIAYTDADGSAISYGPFSANTVKLADLRAPSVRDPYYHKQALFVFEIDEDEWVKKVPDAGPRCFDPNSPDPANPKRIPPQSGGRPFNGIALLDGSGYQITDEAQNSDDPNDWYVENEFAILPTADFDDLDLFDWVAYYETLVGVSADDEELDESSFFGDEADGEGLPFPLPDH